MTEDMKENRLFTTICLMAAILFTACTQDELAERVGRDRSYISRLEKGETDLQLSSFIRIAAALGIMLRLDVNLI